MGNRKILIWPDDRLRAECLPVLDYGEAFQQLVRDMIDTMYVANGAGLAAPQIGEPRCLFVLAVEDDGSIGAPRVFVNPRILETSGEQVADEACLSIPGLTVKIKRPARVELEAQDRDGETFKLVATGFLAAAIMHEHDHLEGRLLVDRLSSLKKSILRKKIQKARKSGRLVSHGAGL